MKLKNCSSRDFFSIESIHFGNKIYNLENKGALRLFGIEKLKNKESSKYFQLILILSVDINLSPGPLKNNHIENLDIWNPFKNRGLHFIHININSLYSKVDEVRDIVFWTKAVVIGFSESKLDDTVNDSEVKIPGYNVLRCDRNRHRGDVA